MDPDAMTGGGRMPEPDDETHEIEHQGRFYRIPNALRGAFLAGDDLNRRAEALAGHQGELQAWQARLSAQHAALECGLDLQVTLHAVDTQLAQFEDVDWEAYAAEDPESAQALWTHFQDLAHSRERYAWALSHHQAEAARMAEQELERQFAETGQVLAREIEGWSPEVAAKLVEYAAAFGVTLDELREIADPRLWKLLHRAHQGEEALTARDTERSALRAQAIRPAASVAGVASGGGMRDELGATEWMRRRNDQTRRAR